MFPVKSEPTLSDRMLRTMVAQRRQRLEKFRALNAPACVIRDAEQLLARGETELQRRELKGLRN